MDRTEVEAVKMNLGGVNIGGRVPLLSLTVTSLAVNVTVIVSPSSRNSRTMLGGPSIVGGTSSTAKCKQLLLTCSSLLKF